MKRSHLLKQVFILSLLLFSNNLFSQTFVEQTGIVLPAVAYSSVAWGDYDRDGDLDLIFAGDSAGTAITRIARNNGLSGFSVQYTIKNLTGVRNGAIAWGDYDNDGDLDILLTGIYTGESRVSKIYSNNGNNTFTEQTGIVLPPLGYCTASWNDFDNDGDLDISYGGSSNAGNYAKINRNNGNNTFTGLSTVDLPTPTRGSMSWGDYDNDGDQDLLITGGAGGLSRIYSNNGDNTFTYQTAISLTGVWYSSTDWGDYDNDGDLDIVLSGEGNSGIVTRVYRNNGDNTFYSAISFQGVTKGSVSWGDYDNDGDLDLLVNGATGNSPNYSPVTKIYRNNGDLTFTEQTGFSLTGTYFGSAVWGDYDADGDLDIVITGFNSSGVRVTKIYANQPVVTNTRPSAPANLNATINNNSVTFTWERSTDTQTPQNTLNYNLYIYESGQSIYDCPPQAFKQTEALNGRRLLARSGNIQWRSAGYRIIDLAPNKTYLWSVQAVDAGMSGGLFSTERSFTMPLYRPVNQAAFIAVSNVYATQVTATWAIGGGTKRAAFIKATTTGTADPVDNVTYALNSVTPGGWRCVYNGTGNSVVVTGLVPNTIYSLHVCEYNGNAGSEQYLKSTASNNPFMINTVFAEQSAISLSGVNGGSLIWGDYNNDGYLDIFMYNSLDGNRIYRNNGNNTFTLQTGIVIPRVNSGSIALGDYDNDGTLDFFLTGTTTGSPNDATSRIFHNNGNSTFTEQTGISFPGVIDSDVAWIDFDKDGDLDILLTGSSGSGIISDIYRNNGDNSFTKQPGIDLHPVYNSALAIADYDNDGDQDILLTGNDLSARVSKIYRNNGDNSFSEQTGIILTGVDDGSVCWGDYDNDGNQDILLTGATGNSPNYNPVSKIYHNNGNNSFTELTTVSLPGVLWSSGAWGDYDCDGDLDILLTGYTGTGYFCKVYTNAGSNSFIEHIGDMLPAVAESSVTWGDYDNDRDLDILIGGYSYAYVITKIFRNEIISKNVRPNPPAGFQSHWDGDCLQFKWNKATDNTTPSKAISYNVRIGTTISGNETKSSQALSDGRLLLAEINNLINDTTIAYRLPLKNYYWSVQSVDKGMYGSAFTSALATPTDSVQARELNAAIKTSSSLLLRWKNGNGIRRVVFGRYSSSSPGARPLNGTVYNAEPYFGLGDKIPSTQWFCLYNGKADSVILYGIDQGYSYDIQVIEYVLVSGLPVYFRTTGSGNPGVFSSTLFSEQTNTSLPAFRASSASWGDYDNDGYLDILVNGELTGGYFSKIYHNNGDNTFSELTGTSLTGICYGTSVWGDYDNDGDLDILLIGVSEAGNIAKIYRNMGSGTFIEQTGIALLGGNWSTADWGDYDNDGNLDIILSGMVDAYTFFNKIYHNNGDNTFTENTASYLPVTYYSSVAWGDYNNDGNQDLFLMGAYGYHLNTSRVYKNDGNGSFTWQSGMNISGLALGDVAWGDYDNDGDLDILITGNANPTPTARIYRNNDDNTFSWQPEIALTGIDEGSVAWGDYDNDGDLDILMAGSDHTAALTKIYRNNGNNSFTELTGLGLKGISRGSVTWGDYDNDGDLDFLITGSTGSGQITSVYRNNTFMKSGRYPANTRPAAPQQLSAVSQPDGVKLSWSPVKSDETSYKALSYNIRIGTTSGGDDIYPAQADRITGYRRLPKYGNVPSDTSFVVKGLTSGIYYWSVQAIDQGFMGGSWADIKSFEVKNVQAFFTADEVCLGLQSHFTDQSVVTDGIASWKWDFKDGTSSSQQHPVHAFGASGAYNVKLVITSTTGIKDSLEKSVTVRPRPITSFTAPSTCAGTQTIITNTTNNNGLTISSWKWDFGDGSSSTLQQPSSHGYLNAGSYAVKLKATASNGCIDSISNNVAVGTYPVAEISTSGPLSFCDGNNVTLSVAQNSQYVYKWKIEGVDITGAESWSFIPGYSGLFSVGVTNPIANCTTVSSQVQVTIKPVPSKPVIISDNYQTGDCPGANPIKIRADQEVIEYSYQWYRNGQPVSGATLPYLEGYLAEGDYTVTAMQNNCSSVSEAFNITYLGAPDKPEIYAIGPNMWYLACSNAMATSYRWYYNGILIPGADKYYYVANQNLGRYQVGISNARGCFTLSDPVSIPLTTGIEDLDNVFAGLRIYPNPTPGHFIIEMNNQVFGELRINIFNSEGTQVLSKRFDKNTEHFLTQVDISGLAKGLYLLDFILDTNFSTRKLVIE